MGCPKQLVALQMAVADLRGRIRLKLPLQLHVGDLMNVCDTPENSFPRETHLPCSLPTGLLCHLDDACISNPCHKGALCDTNPLNGQYICTCPQGYKGADCTEDVDECTMGEYTEPPLFLALCVQLDKCLN